MLENKMKIFSIIIGILLTSSFALAETTYITEITNITLRTGQGTDNKIIAMIKSGDKIEIIEPGQEWTKIRTNNGKEGWVLTRLLTNQKPNKLILLELQNNYNELLQKFDNIAESNKKLYKGNNQLDFNYKNSLKSFNELNTEYKTLKKESSGFLKLPQFTALSVHNAISPFGSLTSFNGFVGKSISQHKLLCFIGATSVLKLLCSFA